LHYKINFNIPNSDLILTAKGSRKRQSTRTYLYDVTRRSRDPWLTETSRHVCAVLYRRAEVSTALPRPQ